MTSLQSRKRINTKWYASSTIAEVTAYAEDYAVKKSNLPYYALSGRHHRLCRNAMMMMISAEELEDILRQCAPIYSVIAHQEPASDIAEATRAFDYTTLIDLTIWECWYTGFYYFLWKCALLLKAKQYIDGLRISLSTHWYFMAPFIRVLRTLLMRMIGDFHAMSCLFPNAFTIWHTMYEEAFALMPFRQQLFRMPRQCNFEHLLLLLRAAFCSVTLQSFIFDTELVSKCAAAAQQIFRHWAAEGLLMLFVSSY